MLESYKHAKNAFVTLTYSDTNLPNGKTLKIKDLQKFLKRLRRRCAPNPIRYYGCGEYGEHTQRPHYHLALFGLGPEDADAISKSWGLGHTLTGELTHDSAEYVAGYVTKKMTHPEAKCTEKCTHPPLNGRLPEFSRMSLRPGIGALAISDIVDVLTSSAGCDALARVGDVPLSLTHGTRVHPIGKYLRGKLREALHFPDKKCPPETMQAWKAEMQKLQKEYVFSKEETTLSKYIDKNQHFKQYLIDKNAQKILQLETKNKIFSADKDIL